MIRFVAAILFCSIPFSAMSAEREAEKFDQQQFDQWFSDVSNWGRWGPDDERGTLNLITPEVRAKAASLVKSGTTVSLSIELDRVKSDHNPHPFEFSVAIVPFGDFSIVSDRYAVEYHGAAHTHLDGLPHMLRKGKMYNGFSADHIKMDGAKKLGIHNMKDGIFTRGVLVDMPWFLGVDYLDAGEAITVSDLEAWQAKTGITLRAGDALLVRTGRWERDRQVGATHLAKGAAGLHASVAKWLKARDVAVLGADGGNDVIPSGLEGVMFPVHALTLHGMGMPILDNLDLDGLSDEALKHDRWEFLFVGAPLRVKGGTGSPINPLAVF